MANSRENKKMYKKGKVITTWSTYVQNLRNHNNANKHQEQSKQN